MVLSAASGAQSSGVFLPPPPTCPPWWPPGATVKDHTIAHDNGYYWLIAMKSDLEESQDTFICAQSEDLCHWEYRGEVLHTGGPGTWNEEAIWAPYLLKEQEQWYMFYTGVTPAICQSIFLATSDDPGGASSWMDQGVVFQPSHPDIIWSGGDHWSDCRDPMVLKVDDTYYMYYTASCLEGGCIAVATSSTLMGPWEDEGPIYVAATGMPESPFVLEREGVYYLFFNNIGEQYATATDPRGPWQDRGILRVEGAKGLVVWANEFLQVEGEWITSFLISGYSVFVRWLGWNENDSPPEPFVIWPLVSNVYLPLVVK